MLLLTEKLIAEAKERYPKASTDLEAIDLWAQAIYKELQTKENTPDYYLQNEYEIHLYHVLRLLRNDLNKEMTEELSSISIN